MLSIFQRTIKDDLWEIPREYREDMRVPTRLYADESLLEDALGDRSIEVRADEHIGATVQGREGIIALQIGSGGIDDFPSLPGDA